MDILFIPEPASMLLSGVSLVGPAVFERKFFKKYPSNFFIR
jgi:hypothetical protein